MSDTKVETIAPTLAGQLEASVWDDRDLGVVQAVGYAVAVQLHGRGVATVDYGPGWTLSILTPTKLRNRYLAALEHQGLCFVWEPAEMTESDIAAAMPISGLLGYVERVVLAAALHRISPTAAAHAHVRSDGTVTLQGVELTAQHEVDGASARAFGRRPAVQTADGLVELLVQHQPDALRVKAAFIKDRMARGSSHLLTGFSTALVVFSIAALLASHVWVILSLAVIGAALLIVQFRLPRQAIRCATMANTIERNVQRERLARIAMRKTEVEDGCDVAGTNDPEIGAALEELGLTMLGGHINGQRMAFNFVGVTARGTDTVNLELLVVPDLELVRLVAQDVAVNHALR